MLCPREWTVFHGFYPPNRSLDRVKDHEVPQDAATSHYGGARKLIYALDSKGDFVGVQSSGWEAEADATTIALALLAQQCEDSWRRAQQDETSPLEYYMYYRRMDVALLAQTSGFFKWRIRRHFKPKIYARLSEKNMLRYAEALELDITTLRHLPEQPLHDAV